MPDADAQLQLKKRARRRLVGAIAFAGLAAVVLPMVMDEEPKQQVQDVQIRIPGQEQAFKPKRLASGAQPAAAEEKVASAKAEAAEPAKAVDAKQEKSSVTEKSGEKVVEKASEAALPRPAEKLPEKPAEKPAEPPGGRTADKASDKSGEKLAGKEVAKGNTPEGDAKRAAAILGGKPVEPVAAAGGQYVVLIGAFANPANVRLLESKLGELHLKTYTQPLESPQGTKIRLRAGPFPNREAAEKALEKMKRIGVGGVVAPK